MKGLLAFVVLLYSFCLYCGEVDDLISDADIEQYAEAKPDKDVESTVFFDAEEFDGVAEVADTWIFYGQQGCSRDRYAIYVGKTEGVWISREIEIPSDGKYKLWTRYFMKIGSNGAFRVRIEQDGKTVFEKKFYDYILDKGDVGKNLEKENGWVFDDPALLDGVISGSVYVWENGTADLKKGKAVVKIISDKQKKPNIPSQIDCFILTKSEKYRPIFKDLTSIYVRFKLLKVAPKDLETSLDLEFGRRDGHEKELGFWFSKGMSGIYNPDGDVFGEGEYTRWVNINPYLNKGRGVCTVMTQFKASKEIEKAELQIQVAWGPSEEQIIKTFVEKGDGSTFAFDLPCELVPEKLYYKYIRSVSEQIRAHYEYAKSLNLDTANLPRLLTFSTSGQLGWKTHFCDEEMLKMEMEVLRTMGVNVLEFATYYDRKLLEEFGFKKTYFTSGGTAMGDDKTNEEENCPNEPDKEKKILEMYKEDFGRVVKKEHGMPEKFMLGDEIGVIVSSKHIERCDYCQLAFRTFLKDYCGLKPEDFGRTSFEKIKYVSNKDDAEGKYGKKLYYYSKKFLSYNTVKFYSKITKAIETVYGQVHTYANYSPAILYSDFMGDLDWIEFGRLRGTNIGWSEDWGYKPVPFLADLLRSAGRYYGEPVGMYIIGFSQDHYRKIMSCLAHGVKTMWFYDYGTAFASADGFSEKTEVVKALAETTRIAGKADDLFYYGKLRRPQVALLYSRSGEIWRKDGATNMELKRIHLILLYNQITVDIINEDDIVNDQLKQYKAVFVVYPNMRLDCARKISEWVKGGGVLIGCAGAGMRDESDGKMRILDEVFGIQQMKVDRTFKQTREWSRGRVTNAPEEYKGKIKITDDKILSPMEIDCMEYKAEIKLVSAKPMAIFADGNPAVSCNEFGTGRALYFGTMPGASLWRGISAIWIPELNEQQKKQFEIFDKIMRDAGVEKDVEISEFGIEATVIECETGAVVPLINYNKAEKQSITVRIKYDRDFKTIESAVRERMEFKKQDGRIEVSFPLKDIDAIIIRH